MSIPFNIKETEELFNKLSTGIVVLNDKLKCIYANKYILNLLELDLNFDKEKDDICEIFFKYVHVDDVQSEKEKKQEFFKYKNNMTSTLRIYVNLNKLQYKWYRSKRFLLGDNFVLSLEDINDSKILELKLQEENNKIELLKQESVNFLAQSTHNIRSPVNGLLGVITLLESTPLTLEQFDYFEMLKECSYTLMTTVNDLLDFSKLEAGKMLLHREKMNVIECIESAGNIILSKVYEKRIEYIANINPDVPQIIFNDYNRIKQVLLNLLYNSVKFTDNGHIYTNVSKISESQYNQYIAKYKKKNVNSKDNGDVFLKFDIIDTGCGIATDDYENLFKSYVQLKTDSLHQGTGLGLVISRELVELMDGCVWLDWSEVNRGSKFCFVIRTKSSEIVEHVPNEQLLQNKRVMIVDDNMFNRISLTSMVQKWGMIANTFSNGEEALISCRYTNYDIALIDICMPGMDGNSLSTKIKQNRNIPMIALSSIGEENISNNFVNYQLKPIRENRLKKLCINTLTTSPNDPKYPKYVTYNPVNSHIKEKASSILIAEDMYINRQVLTKFLKNIGYTNIVESVNGKECIELIYKSNRDFDIILLDIRMPIMNGIEVLEKLTAFYNERNNKNRQKPYVIAVTAYGQDDKEKYIEMGFDDYIPKPIDIKELENCLEKYRIK